MRKFWEMSIAVDAGAGLACVALGKWGWVAFYTVALLCAVEILRRTK